MHILPETCLKKSLHHTECPAQAFFKHTWKAFYPVGNLKKILSNKKMADSQNPLLFQLINFFLFIEIFAVLN